MTQMLETIVLSIAFGDDPAKCPFPHGSKEEKQKKKNIWVHDSSKLGDNLAESAPYLPHLVATKIFVEGKDKPFKLLYNAHHVLPVNGSWEKAKELKKWIDESGKVKDDIGYDVNCSENGIDLPSSNARRGKWKKSKFQNDYAFAAIASTKPPRQFHDSHKPYNAFVARALEKLADKLNAKLQSKKGLGCKSCDPGKEEPYETPMGMLPRINGVAKRIARHLKGSPKKWRVPIMTSKFSLMYKQERLTADAAVAKLNAAKDEMR